MSNVDLFKGNLDKSGSGRNRTILGSGLMKNSEKIYGLNTGINLQDQIASSNCNTALNSAEI